MIYPYPVLYILFKYALKNFLKKFCDKIMMNNIIFYGISWFIELFIFAIWFYGKMNILLGLIYHEGGENVAESILSFLVSVVASIVAYYICKWLDGDDWVVKHCKVAWSAAFFNIKGTWWSIQVPFTWQLFLAFA